MTKSRAEPDSVGAMRGELIVAAALASVMAVSGCSLFGSGAPDVSPEGQVAYACALATNAHENNDFTALDTYIGEDADPGMSEAGAAASLVGAFSGYALPEHPELSEAGTDVLQGLTMMDPERIDSGIADMTSHCEDVPSSGSPDISEEGRAAYACVLARHVRDEHGDSESWGGIGEEPAWHQVTSVGALFGGANASNLDGYEEYAEEAQTVTTAVMRVDVETIDESLDELIALCDS